MVARWLDGFLPAQNHVCMLPISLVLSKFSFSRPFLVFGLLCGKQQPGEAGGTADSLRVACYRVQPGGAVCHQDSMSEPLPSYPGVGSGGLLEPHVPSREQMRCQVHRQPPAHPVYDRAL